MNQTCKKCGGDKPIGGRCLVCRKARMRQYRIDNREKLTAQKAEYCKAHADQVSAYRSKYSRSYREKYKERLAAYHREYYQENRDALSEKQREYRRQHADEIKARRAQWIEKTREERNRYHKEYRESHRGEILDRQRRWARSWYGFACKTWYRLNTRTINGACPDWDNPKNLPYLRKGVELQMDFKAFAEWCETQKETIEDLRRNGDVPSIDRKDSSGHYELSNIQVISLAENCRKAGRRLRKDNNG